MEGGGVGERITSNQPSPGMGTRTGRCALGLTAHLPRHRIVRLAHRGVHLHHTLEGGRVGTSWTRCGTACGGADRCLGCNWARGPCL